MISLYKCKQYEIIIRNFKKLLFNSIEYQENISILTRQSSIQDSNDTDEQHRQLIESNENDFNKISPILNTKNEMLSTIINPKNNLFAYVAFMRWINVKWLELDNDSYIHSKSIYIIYNNKILVYWIFNVKFFNNW